MCVRKESFLTLFKQKGGSGLRRKDMRKKKRAMGLMVAVMVLFVTVPVVLAQEAEKININTAAVEELTQLDQIGPSYAARIVEYRERKGPFQKPADIMQVKGIGQKTWEANADRITVED
jgi:competence protein ComEA